METASSTSVTPAVLEEPGTTPIMRTIEGIQTPKVAMLLLAFVLAALLFFGIPSLINASRYPIPDDVAGMIGRPGLRPDDAAKVSAAIKASLQQPPRFFFPCCAVIFAAVFAIVEGFYWKRWGVIGWASLIGPVIGLGAGILAAETTTWYFFNFGKSANSDVTANLTLHTISLGLVGGGTGLAIGLVARSIAVIAMATLSGLMSGFVASSLFVILTSTLFPTQMLSYPIPGASLESFEDTATIAIWAVCLPLCLALGLMSAKPRPKPDAPKTTDPEPVSSN